MDQTYRWQANWDIRTALLGKEKRKTGQPVSRMNGVPRKDKEANAEGLSLSGHL